eukprot:1443126-Rhodomonas_salina.1
MPDVQSQHRTSRREEGDLEPAAVLPVFLVPREVRRDLPRQAMSGPAGAGAGEKSSVLCSSGGSAACGGSSLSLELRAAAAMSVPDSSDAKAWHSWQCAWGGKIPAGRQGTKRGSETLPLPATFDLAAAGVCTLDAANHLLPNLRDEGAQEGGGKDAGGDAMFMGAGHRRLAALSASKTSCRAAAVDGNAACSARSAGRTPDGTHKARIRNPENEKETPLRNAALFELGTTATCEGWERTFGV